MFLIEHRFNNNDYCQPGEEHRETTIRRRRQCHAIDFFQSKHQCADARVYVSLRDGERVRMRLLQLPEVLHCPCPMQQLAISVLIKPVRCIDLEREPSVGSTVDKYGRLSTSIVETKWP